MAQVVLADTERDQLFELLLRSVDDPAFFIAAILDPRDREGNPAPLRPWQRDLCERIKAKLVAGERHVEVLARTAHGSGKTWISAALLLWFICTRPYSRGLTTAPTWSQVEGTLWPEIARLYNGSLLRHLGFGRLLSTKFEVSDTWFAIGASSDKPENLEGQQSNVASVRIVDEAKAVDKEVFDATKGMLGAPETLDLWISTPSIQAGEFYKRDVSEDESVIRVAVSIDDLIAQGVPGKQDWKDKAIRDWGIDSAEYQSRALARYIDNAEGALFPVSWLERAMAQTWDCSGPVVAGMDVAGSVDGDQNAVALVQGPDPSTEKLQVKSVDAWHERDTMFSKGRALSIARPFKARLHVDSIGLGKGVADSLREMKYPVAEYRSTDKPRDPERFVNRKAEDAWTFREMLEKGTIRLPVNQLLKSQAASVKYRVMQSGKIRVEDPPDSPDLVDSVLIAVSNAGGRQTRTADSGERMVEEREAWSSAF